MKAAEYGTYTSASSAFVATNSICQGQQVSSLWPAIFRTSHKISFAYTSFKWANLASHNAGVIVVIVGISSRSSRTRRIYFTSRDENVTSKECENINAYLVPTHDVYVSPVSKPLNGLHEMDYGSKPADGGNLILSSDEKMRLNLPSDLKELVLPYIGSTEFIEGKQRYCIWMDKRSLTDTQRVPEIVKRIARVRAFRQQSNKKPTRVAAETPYAFLEIRYGNSARTSAPFIVPIHTSENRNFLPVGVLPVGSVVSNAAFAIYRAGTANSDRGISGSSARSRP
jgi:hypothetical protein